MRASINGFSITTVLQEDYCQSAAHIGEPSRGRGKQDRGSGELRSLLESTGREESNRKKKENTKVSAGSLYQLDALGRKRQSVDEAQIDFFERPLLGIITE